MGSCVPFVFPWASLAYFLPWASSTFFLTLYFHGLLLTSLGFPGPITSYSSLGFMGLPSIPYSLYLHCYGPTVAHSYFFSHHTLPMGLLLTTSLFPSSFEPICFLKAIYLFHGLVIHCSCRLGLMVFCSLSLANFSMLLSWASFLTFGFHKKGPSTFSPLNIWSAPAAHM